MQRLDKKQSAITKQLYSFIKLQNIPIDECLASLSIPTMGHCFGFSLCRASMRITGKLAWWEAAMTLIAAWDGQESSLNDEYILPGANDDIPVPLKRIFDRFIHYIVFNQARGSQDSFLNPGGDFILLRDNNEILKVKRKISISGHFDVENLSNVLSDGDTKNALAQNICLIGAFTHGCELSFNDKTRQWGFYDPNYTEGTAKLFSSPSDLAKEIRRVLGEALNIRLVVLDDKQSKPFSEYYSLLERSPETLMQKFGWYITALRNAEVLPTVTEYFKTNGTLGFLQHILQNILHQNPATLNQLSQHLDAMKVFTVLNVDLNTTNRSDGYNLLMRAARFGITRVIDHLCIVGANTEQINPLTDRTALLTAIAYNQIAAIKMLLNHMTDINHSTILDGTPLMLAIKKGHVEAAQTLISYNPNLHATATLDIADILNVAKIKNRQLEVEAYLKQQDGKLPLCLLSRTALHYAVIFGHTSIVATLLENMPRLSIEMLTHLREISLAMDHSPVHALLLLQQAYPTYPRLTRPEILPAPPTLRSDRQSESPHKRKRPPITESSFAALPSPNTLMLNTGETTVKVSLKSLNEWRTLQSKVMAPGIISMSKVKGELFYLITFSADNGVEKYKDWHNNQIQEPSFKKSRHTPPPPLIPPSLNQTSAPYEANVPLSLNTQKRKFSTFSNSHSSLFSRNSSLTPPSMPPHKPMFKK